MSEGAGASAPASAAPVADSAAPAESNTQAQGAQGQENSSGSPEAADVQAALEAGEISPKEAQQLVKKFKLKVDGKELETEVDLSDEDFIRNQLQLAAVSKKRMQESSELKKAFQKEIERMKQSPWEVLQELGLDPDQLAESRIQQRIEEMKKSPEQLEREKIQAELKAAREEAERLRSEKSEIEMQKMREQAAVQIEDEISKALDGHKTLPKSQYVVKRIADSMLWAMNNGFEDVSAEDVVPLVESEMREELNRFMDDMPEDVMEKYIGQRNIDRMRKRRVAAAKAAPTANDIKPTAASQKAAADAAAAKEQQRLRSKDFFRKLGR